MEKKSPSKKKEKKGKKKKKKKRRKKRKKKKRRKRKKRKGEKKRKAQSATEYPPSSLSPPPPKKKVNKRMGRESTDKSNGKSTQLGRHARSHGKVARSKAKPQNPAQGKPNLIAAIANGRLKVATRMVLNGEVECVGSMGETPFMLVCDRGHTLLALLMITMNLGNLGLAVADIYGRTAFMRLCARGGTAVITRLLELGIPITAQRSHKGQTGFHEACTRGQLEVVTLLLGQPQMVVNVPDNRNVTPIMAAVIAGHFAVVMALLADPRVNVGGIFEWLCYTTLANPDCPHHAELKGLMEHPRIAPNLPIPEGGPTYIEQLADSSECQVMERLLPIPMIEKPASLMTRACRAGNLQMVKLLAEWGFDPLTKDERGMSGVELAVYYQRHEVVGWLAGRGYVRGDEAASCVL